MKFMDVLVISFITITFAGLVLADTGNCTGVSPCKCVFQDGMVLDLEPLSKQDGTSYFGNVTDANDDTYFWNPCFPFEYKPGRNSSDCENVAVCMTRRGFPKPLIYDLGDQTTAKFSTDKGGNVTLSYYADKGEFDRITNIELRCSPNLHSDHIFADVEKDLTNVTTVYHLVLFSKHACGHAPNIGPAKHNDNSLSGGAIFAIVFFSLIGSYLLFGAAIQFAGGKRGKRMFPNHDFWCVAVPGICKGTGEKLGGGDKGAKYDSI